MPRSCTCGAQLVEDALFCHRCGKPQREDLVEREEAAARAERSRILQAEAPAAEIALAKSLAPQAISFSNRSAVRVCLLSAALACVLMLINFGIFHILWMIVLLTVSGFLAVYLYHRRSGEHLTVGSGARMGWMTAVFTFLFFLIILIPTMTTMVLQWRRGTLAETLREQAQNQPISDAQLQEMLRLFESPAAFAATLLLAAGLAFVFFTILAVIGGALGAKVLERD